MLFTQPVRELRLVLRPGQPRPGLLHTRGGQRQLSLKLAIVEPEQRRAGFDPIAPPYRYLRHDAGNRRAHGDVAGPGFDNSGPGNMGLKRGLYLG